MTKRAAARLAGALLVGCVAWTQPVSAQHEHPAPAPGGAAAEPQHEHVHGAGPETVFSPRDASGTSWLPDVTPMYGFHSQAGGWELMLHGNGFLQLLHEDAPAPRGATQAGSINWVMAMARRPVGSAHAGVRAMLSLEPWTIRGCGYPNLLATGEVCDGASIHDRQHPHDLFMELAGEIDRPLAGGVRWQVYGGVVGEPALGPPAFPHRLSAMPNPLSPITHHWLDSTHISYGVVTTGVSGTRWKAEASVFNGREPDERRYDFDLAALDSVSARLWFAPTGTLTVQVSAGHLKDAEQPETRGPSLDVDRVTSSATYHHRSGQRLWATTLAWGANRESGETTHGLLAESSVGLSSRHTLFGRLEVNGKPASDLDIRAADEVFSVGKLQGGYTHYLGATGGLTPGIGATVSAALVPEALRPRYGGIGVGVGVFLTLRPVAHEMAP